MARTRWHRGFRSVRVNVPCDGAVHEVLWRRGSLVVPEHDVRAELALVALGAAPPPCIAVLRAWRAAHRGPGLGAFWDLDGALGARTRWVTSRTLGVPADERSLPEPLHRLAALAAVVRADRRWSDPSLATADRNRIEHFLAVRVREAVDASVGPVHLYRPRFDVLVRCGVAEPGGDTFVAFSSSSNLGRLVCRLPLSWIVDVWARGISVVDDTTVIAAVSERNVRDVRVTGLRWEPHGLYGLRPDLVTALARARDGRWRLECVTGLGPLDAATVLPDLRDRRGERACAS